MSTVTAPTTAPTRTPAPATLATLDILTAAHYQSLDACPRRLALERDWIPRTLSPLGLAYRALAAAVRAPATEDAEQVAKDAALRSLTTHELPATDLDAYSTAVHLGYLAGLIACHMRSRLGVLRRPDPVPFLGSEWRSGCWEDLRGDLHRLVLVSHWDDDRLRAEAHSWATIGELAALDRPLTLWAIIIGAARLGRRHSSWTRGFLHPQNHALRFRRKGAGAAGERDPDVAAATFSGDWQRVWREQCPQVSTRNWLAVMRDDGVLGELVIERRVDLRKDDLRLAAARSEMAQLARQMPDARAESPMRRSSCNDPMRGACPFQALCYSPLPVQAAELPHLYRKRG